MEKIDLLNFIPKKTASGYDIFVEDIKKNNEDHLKIWYKHPRIKPIELRRYIDAGVLGSLLGQYQAEGTKYNNLPRKLAVEFSNMNIKEHVDFVSGLNVLGIRKEMLVFQLRNSSIGNEEIVERYKTEFENKVGKIRNQYLHVSKRGGFGFRTIFRSILFTEIFLSLMNNLRKNAIEHPDEYRIFLDNFFAKLLTGDGTFNPDKRRPVPRVHISIKDENKEYLNDYVHIFKTLGFGYVRLYDKHKTVEANCSFNNLLYLYRINAFKNTNNWNKLIVTIGMFLNGRRLKTKLRFLDFNSGEHFTAKNIAIKYNLHPEDTKWLKNMVKTGYIERNCNNIPYEYFMTGKAKELAELLTAWQKDLDDIIRIKGINSLSELQYSLKLHPRLTEQRT